MLRLGGPVSRTGFPTWAFSRGAGAVVKGRLLLIFALVAGAGVRLYHLGQRSLWFDEMLTQLAPIVKAKATA